MAEMMSVAVEGAKHVTVICRMDVRVEFENMKSKDFEKEIEKMCGVKVSGVEWMRSDDGGTWRWAMRVTFSQLKKVCECKMLYVEIPVWQREKLNMDLVILRYKNKPDEKLNESEVYRENYWGMIKQPHAESPWGMRYTREQANVIAKMEGREHVTWPVYVITQVDRNYGVEEVQEAVDGSGWEGKVDPEDKKGPKGTRTWQVAAPKPPAFQGISVNGEDWAIITIEQDRRARREWREWVMKKEQAPMMMEYGGKGAAKGKGGGKGEPPNGQQQLGQMNQEQMAQMIQQEVEKKVTEVVQGQLTTKMEAFKTRVLTIIDDKIVERVGIAINPYIEKLSTQQEKAKGEMDERMNELKGLMEKLVQTQQQVAKPEAYFLGTPDGKKAKKARAMEEGEEVMAELEEDSEVKDHADGENASMERKSPPRERTPRMERKQLKKGDRVKATEAFEVVSARGMKKVTVEEGMEGEVRTHDEDAVVVKFVGIQGLMKVEAEKTSYIVVIERAGGR